MICLFSELCLSPGILVNESVVPDAVQCKLVAVGVFSPAKLHESGGVFTVSTGCGLCCLTACSSAPACSVPPSISSTACFRPRAGFAAYHSPV